MYRIEYFIIIYIYFRSESRQFVPAIDQYFEDAIMAADPRNQIEDAYK